MIQAFFEGKKIVEIRNSGYLIDAFTKLQTVSVTFEDGSRRTVRTDAVELIEVADV